MKLLAATLFLSVTTIAVVSSVFSPANAYSVTSTSIQAGNPASYLYDIGLNTDDIGRKLDPVTWFVSKIDANAPVDLIATSEITVKDFQADFLELAIKLTNNTASSYQASIVSFGFGVNPNATGVQWVDKGDTFSSVQINSNANFPGGFKNIDVCIYPTNNNCSGGNINRGLQSGGEFDEFQLRILGNFASDPAKRQVTLSAFPIKFQTQNGSYEPAGVPEPMTMVGSGLALGFGALFKKGSDKKRKKAGTKDSLL